MLRRTAKKALKHLHSNHFVPLNRIELSRTATLHNVDMVLQQHPGFEIIPVLKANAYGHGLVQMAEILNAANCAFVAVDGYFEAAQIRDISTHPILVMGYIRPENVRLLDTKRCSFVVQDIAGLEALAHLGKPVRVHMELNTGMNRLGLQPEEIDEYLKALKQFPTLRLEGIMSHLADADNELDDSYTAHQAELFDELIERIKSKGFKPRFIHLAQTAGSTKATSKYANAIRLGIGLYGLNPLTSKDARYKELEGLRPVLEFKSTAIKILNLKKGDRVSYNGIYTAPEDMKIAVLPLGYYEGIPRALSNTGTVLYHQKKQLTYLDAPQGVGEAQTEPYMKYSEGALEPETPRSAKSSSGVGSSADNQATMLRELPIVGRVCMNHTMINIEGTDIKVGSEITVISSDPGQPNAVNNICRDHNLFNYSFVTGLASSTRRTIV